MHTTRRVFDCLCVCVDVHVYVRCVHSVTLTTVCPVLDPTPGSATEAIGQPTERCAASRNQSDSRRSACEHNLPYAPMLLWLMMILHEMLCVVL